jgi:hypothetical protein
LPPGSRDAHAAIPLWFSAAYLGTTQTPRQSAIQFQRQLGLTRYETDYQILDQLRAGLQRGGVHRERSPGAVRAVRFGPAERDGWPRPEADAPRRKSCMPPQIPRAITGLRALRWLSSRPSSNLARWLPHSLACPGPSTRS